MTTVPVGTHIYHYCRLESHKIPIISTKYKQSSLNYSKKVSCLLKNGAKTSYFRPYVACRGMKTTFGATANASTSDMAVLDTAVSGDVIFQETFPLQRIEKVFSYPSVSVFVNLCVLIS